MLTCPSVCKEASSRSEFPDYRWPARISTLLDLGMIWLDWVGSGWVVEGNKQLEMGANVECEELGCVVGGPFKPNKLREVQGLVWKPWINKPSEMTMRCADICHHTAPASKYKSCKRSLPPPRFHVLCPSRPIYPLFFLSSPFCLYFDTICALSWHFSLRFICCSIPLPYLQSSSSSLPSGSIHPSIRSSIHAWLAVRPGFCMCYRQSYGTALALSRLITAETLGGSGPESVYLSKREAVSPLTATFLLFLTQGTSQI